MSLVPSAFISLILRIFILPVSGRFVSLVSSDMYEHIISRLYSYTHLTFKKFSEMGCAIGLRVLQRSSNRWWRGSEKYHRPYHLLPESLIVFYINRSASAIAFSKRVSDIETIQSNIKWIHETRLLYIEGHQFSSTHDMVVRLQNEWDTWGSSLVQHLSNFSYRQHKHW